MALYKNHYLHVQDNKQKKQEITTRTVTTITTKKEDWVVKMLYY